MSKITDIRKAIRETFENKSLEFKAVLGRADGTVRASGTDVYVTLMNGNVQTVFNDRVPSIAFRKVVLGYDEVHYPNVLQVLRFDDVYNERPIAMVINHADSHAWYSHDPVSVSLEQIMELLPRAIGGMVVRVYGGKFIADGAFHVMDTRDIDMSAELPASGAEWVNAEIDAVGVVTFNHSANKGSREVLYPEDIALTDITKKLLYSAKMYAGLVKFIQTPTDSDIFDPRITGLSSGGGLPDAPSDSVYYGRRNGLWTNLKTYFDGIYQAIGSYVASTRTISTTAPLAGGGDLSADRTLSITAATTLAAGSMSSTDKTKLDAISGSNTGDVTLAGTPNYITIVGQVVTRALIGLSHMADVATATVFYRKTAGTGAPEVQTLATLKTDLGLTGTNSGDTGVPGVTSTAAAGTTTTLIAASTDIQELTGNGSNAHIFKMPDVTTLVLGRRYYFINNMGGTNSLTVIASGGATITSFLSGGSAILTCVAITGTTATSWGAGTTSEGNIILTDSTNTDASTTKHGFAIKAVAPAANILNVVGIENGETVYVNKSIYRDGWIPVIGTFSWASASTINISAGGAARYTKGDKLKWITNTGSTQRYATIITVADTLLTVAVNTDHVLVNEAWTLPFYSHEENPLGWPGWFNYVPSIPKITTTPACAIAKYKINGSDIRLEVYVNNKTLSAGAVASVDIPLPVTMATDIVSLSQIQYAGTTVTASIQKTTTNLSVYKSSAFGGWAGGETGVYIWISMAYSW